MSTSMHRRRFLTASCQTLAGFAAASCAHPLLAMEPIRRDGPARLLLSLAAYSFRDFFAGGKAATRKQIDLFQFIDFCAAHGCVGTELTSYYFPREITPEFLLKLKLHAYQRGTPISGTAVGNTFTVPKGPKRDQEIASVKKWIDRAQILGAPHIRVFAGNVSGTSEADARRLCIEALQECCDYAGSKGVVLGLENHGGIVADADGLLEIVRAVQSPWFGVNLDTGNYRTADPYADIARCAPYAVNVQIKSELAPRGQAKQAADLPRLIKILREANYQGFVALEYEAAEDPWTAVPSYLAQLKPLLD